jgi:hypothetical protein
VTHDTSLTSILLTKSWKEKGLVRGLGKGYKGINVSTLNLLAILKATETVALLGKIPVHVLSEDQKKVVCEPH